MSPTAHRTRIGSLDCIVVDGGTKPTIAVVICHGYGASYDDLAPLAGEWMRVLGDLSEQFRFVFPNAPENLAEMGMPDGRAWWPISMGQMAEMLRATSFAELHDQEPQELEHARELLSETIGAVKQEIAGDSTPLVLGGFSQGAMLTMDTALRGTIDPPKILIQFSGTVICRQQWEAAIHRLDNAYVFQSHGTIDPILPHASAITLHEVFAAGQIDTEFHSFIGPHTIDGESVAKTAAALAKLA